MRPLQRTVHSVGIVALALGLTAAISSGQDARRPQAIEIPADATALEGVPTVRIDTADARTTRHVNRRLRLSSSGDYTYLSSEPGNYIRMTRVNDRVSYVEHVDLGSESITWWGELTIRIGK